MQHSEVQPHGLRLGTAASLTRLARPVRRRDLGTRLGAILAILIISTALLAPWLAPHPPARQNLIDAFAPPSRTYLLGTDHLGRDILSRLMFGARTTLGATALVLLVILTIAMIVGLVAGFFGGWIDHILMRLVDLVLAFPGLILAIAVAGTLGPGLLNVTLALALVWWASYARLIRALVLQVREREYITAAAALGVPPLRIVTVHILPNILGPLVVVASLDLGAIVLSIAGLNFLGLGAQPPTPEWGAMLNAAQPFLQTEPQLILAPAGAMILTVLAFNLLGDGLRDWLDPQLR
ncbi:MAG: nickel transporter permease [Oscillochloridaceae bacterium umkhey_bin13]